MSSESLRVGPYELLTPIGSGGESEVFIARRPGEAARLALKLQQALPDHATVQRFFDAARAAARLSHAHVLPVLDVGESDGRMYLAMPLVEGISLARLIRLMRVNQIQLPIPIVRLIAAGMLDALAHAHAREPVPLVHGDISPSNVMLSTTGEVLLADFGLTEAGRAEHQPRKKCAYLSPEQIRGGALTPRADLFSAAVTLYEAATLSAPFQHPGDAETMEAVVTHQQPSASTLRHELSERAALALDRCLSKDPERRFGMVRQLRERFIDGDVASPAELGALVQTWGKDDLKVFGVGPAAPPPAPPPPVAVARKRSLVPAVVVLAAALAAAAGAAVWLRPVAPPPVLPLPPPPPMPEPKPITPVPVEPNLPIVEPGH